MAVATALRAKTPYPNGVNIRPCAGGVRTGWKKRRVPVNFTGTRHLYLSCLWSGFLRRLDDRHNAAVEASAFEADDTIDEGKQSVVFAHPDVYTRVVLSPSLAYDDVAGFASVAAEYFHAESFAV